MNKTDKDNFIDMLTSMVDVIPDNEMEEIKAKEEINAKAKRESMFYSMVPLRYREVTFEGDPKLLSSQRSVIYGPYGTGKTWLGYSIAKELYVSGEVSDFTIQREREIYNNMLAYQNNPARYKELYYEPDLLVIDEFGKNSQSDASASQIFNIIDYRYDWKKRTILICNAKDADELRKIVPQAIQDRFIGSTHLLAGKSRRVAE
jgi:DNA replication protein DnaC